ncbi:AraC family transcriptional regulator [Verrucomicrobiaceae bacterium N1E253]|uniref:AraC family transcriptional regulator n=1 Tax=Oceaniferula marina TaxID=2748318 RepID=A0A851GNR3_9BACT|nr:helix-turn-helix domain-containing protein [Oceaniferula marina]NWK55774.1 AraC family transcriptional regulator [Oceaniferula marina]
MLYDLKSSVCLDAQPNYMLIHKGFGNFDAHAEAYRGWDVDLALLSKGNFTSELFQVIDPTAGYYFGRNYFSHPTQQVGTPPSGVRTFAFLTTLDGGLHWRGQMVTGLDVMVFPDGGELFAINQPEFHLASLSVTDETLRQLAEVTGYQQVLEDMDKGEVFRLTLKGMQLVLKEMCRYEALLAKPHYSADLVAQMDRVFIALLRGLSQTDSRSKVICSKKKANAVRQAECYLRAHAQEVPDTKKLCEITGVSDRTLQVGFKETFGVTPKAYLQAIRLSRVHQILRRSKLKNLKIADVANAWGFWHMGQFAADYQKSFGEKPSQSLFSD